MSQNRYKRDRRRASANTAGGPINGLYELALSDRFGATVAVMRARIIYDAEPIPLSSDFAWPAGYDTVIPRIFARQGANNFPCTRAQEVGMELHLTFAGLGPTSYNLIIPPFLRALGLPSGMIPGPRSIDVPAL
jgi:hypothetical protein